MAAGSTYTPIATYTVPSNTASYTFSSIPSTYTDLRLVVTGGMTGSGYFYVQYNGDSASNYSRTEAYGYGASTGSFRAANLIPISMDTTLGTCINKIDIMDYSNTNVYKTCLYRTDLAAGLAMAGVGLWRSTTAINSIAVIGYTTSNLLAGSTLTLYGIAAA